MRNRIIALFVLLYIAISSIFLFAIALCIWLLTRWFDRRLVLLHQFTCFWACHYLWAMPAWRVHLSGRERLRKDGVYIIVSNHQSQLDILLAFRLFFPFKWVSKIEVFRLPLIGWNMYLNRYIPLKRGDKESIARMLSRCEDALAQGSSIYMFPEGTRSTSTRLRPFKPGAFLLAHKLKLPLLAIAINGTRKALPKYSLNFHGRQELQITVLGEIPYAEFADLSVSETAEMVRSRIAGHVHG
ncbi:MAG: lysophospholipid acyltransferase family protein [Desulfosarcinaceae bacterium]|nr:lysophospholipid acyltransferase family protein [Desulfosarcinaceae bacterium]